MANFNMHISVATVASGLVATLCLQVGFVSTQDALLLTLIGTLGGILPDIDLSYSYPSRIIFSLLGLGGAFTIIFAKANEWSVLELWLVGTLVFVLIRFPLWRVFHQNTRHRGMVHSVPAALLTLFVTTIFSYYVLEKSAFTSWLMGSMAFFGFIIHLILDELYSVDFMNRRIKRSFGTAFKLYDKKYHGRSLTIISLMFVAAAFTPSSDAFIDTFTTPNAYAVIYDRLLPSGEWFQ